jgi:hypothetical protein
MREYTSELMSHGPILIIRNVFPTLARVFLFLVIIKSEIPKTLIPFATILKTQKYIYFTVLVYFLLFNFYYFILLDILISKPYALQPFGGVGDTR